MSCSGLKNGRMVALYEGVHERRMWKKEKSKESMACMKWPSHTVLSCWERWTGLGGLTHTSLRARAAEGADGADKDDEGDESSHSHADNHGHRQRLCGQQMIAAYNNTAWTSRVNSTSNHSGTEPGFLLLDKRASRDRALLCHLKQTHQSKMGSERKMSNQTPNRANLITCKKKKKFYYLRNLDMLAVTTLMCRVFSF